MYRDLREWLDEVEGIGELRRISGAELDTDIPQITEIAEHAISGPAVLFDAIPGYGRTAHPGQSAQLAESHRADGRLSGRADQAGLRRPLERQAAKFEPRARAASSATVRFSRTSARRRPDRPDRAARRRSGTARTAAATSAPATPSSRATPIAARSTSAPTASACIDAHHVFCYISPGKHGRINRDKYFAQGKPCPMAISSRPRPAAAARRRR